jgi:hypothetical protein
VASKIKYVRRHRVEGKKACLVIIDVKAEKDLRIINIYRTFAHQDGSTPRVFFNHQLSLVKLAFTNITIFLGDFNLGGSKRGELNYMFKNYFLDMDPILENCKLNQLINFPTCSRYVNNIPNESTLDHTYTTDPTFISKINNVSPYFGHHQMITFNYSCSKPIETHSIRRNWKNCSKTILH